MSTINRLGNRVPAKMGIKSAPYLHLDMVLFGCFGANVSHQILPKYYHEKVRFCISFCFKFYAKLAIPKKCKICTTEPLQKGAEKGAKTKMHNGLVGVMRLFYIIWPYTFSYDYFKILVMVAVCDFLYFHNQHLFKLSDEVAFAMF